MLLIFDKLPITDCIEVYKSAGDALHQRISEHQENLNQQNKKLEEEKKKISATKADK